MSKWKSTIAISQTPEKRRKTTVIKRAHSELQQYLTLKSDYVVIGIVEAIRAATLSSQG